MRTTLTTLAALTLTLALAGPAAAQNEGAPDTTYDFEDDDVEGSYRSPLGENIILRGRSNRTSLVRARMHFVPELMKSVEGV